MKIKFNDFLRHNLNEKITSREELNQGHLPGYDIIEPALMTKNEYLEYLEAFKSHPEDAYLFSIERDNAQIPKDKLEKEYNLINTIKHGSEYIKYYVNNGEKNKSDKYIKVDDDGIVMRDDDGIALYMSEDEIKKAGYRERYDRSVIAVNNNQQIVGSAQDEWGCVLIYVVIEYNGVGIGKELVNFYRNYYPSKSSGGTTSSGHKNLIKYHERQVRLYLRNGLYSDMVKKGELTKDKAKEIIDSINKTPYDKHDKDNVYTKFSNVKKYNRAILHSGNDIMLFNDEIINFYKYFDDNNGDVNDLSEKFIFAHLRIHEEESLGDEFIRLYFLDGNNEEDIFEAIKYSLSYIKMKFKTDSFRYYITENTNELTKKTILNLENNKDFNIEKVPNDVNRYIISANNLNTYNYNQKLHKDTKWFYSLDDKYDEIKERITEDVYKNY